MLINDPTVFLIDRNQLIDQLQCGFGMVAQLRPWINFD